MDKIVEFLSTDKVLAKKYIKTMYIRSKSIVEDINNSIVIIISGLAMIEFREEDKWESMCILSKGDFVGIEILLENQTDMPHFNYRLKSVSTIKCYMVDKDYFLDHLYANPIIFHRILERLAFHYNFEIKKISTEKNVEKQLALFILQATQNGKEEMLSLPKEISVSLIASVLKRSRNKVKQILVDWVENNALYSFKPIIIKDISLIRNIVESF